MVYPIDGGDFQAAGAASSTVKAALKRTGVKPEIVRRVTIATYEAEMNVVIHAHKGQMRVTLEQGRLDVEVTDEGPGIPDIGLAMKQGFSTADPVARELGFGAGMGLPNIQKNTDHFVIDSVVGQGTRLRFSIYLEPQEAGGHARNSLRLDGERCRGCLRCLHVCPTGALRVRAGGPVVLEHLCIDGGACISACHAEAISIQPTTGLPQASPDTVLVVPPAALVQFGAAVSPVQVVETLGQLGYGEVFVTSGLERALRKAVVRYAREEAKLKPVISPSCLAVINLIQVRFPSLIEHVAPFLSPIEAAQFKNRGPFHFE